MPLLDNSHILAASAGFFVAFVTSLALVLTKHLHGAYTLDQDNGVQKVHKTPTPRVGGVALGLGYIAAWFCLEGESKSLFGMVGIAGLPAILFGLAEDITKKIGVGARLIATITSGLIFAGLTGYTINHIGMWGFDSLLALPWFAFAFTAFAIGGVANAINLIDGFHGLASGTLFIILLAFALLGLRVGDTVFVELSLLMAAIIAGFFVVNFPMGKLFLGDAGAYFAGYFVATLAVMLPARNPEVSPWISLLVLSYPVTETLVSILRRIFDADSHPGAPDSAHFHHIIHRTWALKASNSLKTPQAQNALTSLFMWALPILTLVSVAYCGLGSSQALIYLSCFVVLYLVTYRTTGAYDPEF